MLVALRWALFVGAVVAGASGCASTCREVASSRHAFLRAARPSADWHVALALPHAAVSHLINRHLAGVPPLRLGVPGPLGALLPPLVLSTKRVELRPAAEGKVGFHVELDASLGGESAFSMAAEVAVAPRVTEQRELEVALRPADVQEVVPRIAPGALDRLTDLVWRRLPARSLISRRTASEVAGALLTLLGTQLHRLLRATVLPKLGALSHLRLALPPYLPVEQVGFRSGGGGSTPALVVLVRTRLAVSPGLSIEQAAAARGVPGRFHLVLPGAAAAALTNWGMAEKLLPARFDSDAHAQADGPNEVALDWKPGPRPLKVIAWRLHGVPCGEVRLGGEPELRVPRRGSVELGVRDAQVERVSGSSWLQAAVWLRTRFSDSFTITRKLAADSKLTVGGKPLQLTVVEGDYGNGLFWVGLEVAPAAGCDPRCRSSSSTRSPAGSPATSRSSPVPGPSMRCTSARPAGSGPRRSSF